MKILKINSFKLQNVLQKSFSRLNFSKKLKCDTFEISSIKLIPPSQTNILPYFNNSYTDISKLYRSNDDKYLSELVEYYRKNEEKSVKIITSVRELCQNEDFGFKEAFNFNNTKLRHLAIIILMNCFDFPSRVPIKYNPLDYYRIFRTIGESEYNALLKGKHIVSPLCNNESVMVTNNPRGVSACASGKKYFVSYKDKPNFDPLANLLYNLSENKVPHITTHNGSNAEYYLIGGYNINDVESIIDSSRTMVYRSK